MAIGAIGDIWPLEQPAQHTTVDERAALLPLDRNSMIGFFSCDIGCSWGRRFDGLRARGVHSAGQGLSADLTAHCHAKRALISTNNPPLLSYRFRVA